MRGVCITLDRQERDGTEGPSAAHVLKRFRRERAEEPAAGKAQASSSSSAPAVVPDAGSTAPHVPMDASSGAPWVRQDEVSAMERTSSAVVTELHAMCGGGGRAREQTTAHRCRVADDS